WRDSGEKKYYLSNLPQRTSLRRLVAAVKARWSCEQVHQQLKQELGLGDFEGRSWTGLHRHALMTCIAFAYLQHRRLKAAGRGKKRWCPTDRRRSHRCLRSAAPSSPGCSLRLRFLIVARTATGGFFNTLPKCQSSDRARPADHESTPGPGPAVHRLSR